MQGFQDLHGEMESLGARVAGISADTFAALGAFAEQNGFDFELLSDWPGLKTCDSFGTRREGAPVAERKTFVFDGDGVLRAVIDEPRDMAAHSAGAVKELREIAGG